MQKASDEAIFDRATLEERVLVSANTDFGTLIALRRKSRPSLILLRRTSRHPNDQLSLLLTILPSLEKNLEEGSIVVLEDTRIRLRPLPIENPKG